MSKRLLLARALKVSGLLALADLLPSKPGVLVVNHHRIGDAGATRFDRGVFSQTTAGLDEQVSFLRKRMPIVAGEELRALLTGTRPITRTYAAITFDDGYLDNYTNAFSVLQSHGVPGIFFPVIDYIGSDAVPWWDEIAYLVRNTARSVLEIQTPVPLRLQVTGDRERVIWQVLRHYKRADNRNGEAFLQQLRDSARCAVPNPGRRFFNWDEARIMSAAGMEIGSHTHTHTVLSQQTPEQQRWELSESRRVLQQELQQPVLSLAYPVGSATAFTAQTAEIAENVGYRVAYAFQGGWNTPSDVDLGQVRRVGLAPEHALYRTELLRLVKGVTFW